MLGKLSAEKQHIFCLRAERLLDDFAADVEGAWNVLLCMGDTYVLEKSAQSAVRHQQEALDKMRSYQKRLFEKTSADESIDNVAITKRAALLVAMWNLRLDDDPELSFRAKQFHDSCQLWTPHKELRPYLRYHPGMNVECCIGQQVGAGVLVKIQKDRDPVYGVIDSAQEKLAAFRLRASVEGMAQQCGAMTPWVQGGPRA